MLIDLTPQNPRWDVVLPVLRELRPHLTCALLEELAREGEEQGLRFTAVLEGDRCVAVAGWRVIVNTSALRKLYVDDLCTSSEERSRGHGGRLLRHLVDRARQLGCHRVDLDSGVQRYDAHRFYQRAGMAITAHHFSLELP